MSFTLKGLPWHTAPTSQQIPENTSMQTLTVRPSACWWWSHILESRWREDESRTLSRWPEDQHTLLGRPEVNEETEMPLVSIICCQMSEENANGTKGQKQQNTAIHCNELAFVEQKIHKWVKWKHIIHGRLALCQSEPSAKVRTCNWHQCGSGSFDNSVTTDTSVALASLPARPSLPRSVSTSPQQWQPFSGTKIVFIEPVRHYNSL